MLAERICFVLLQTLVKLLFTGGVIITKLIFVLYD